MARDFAAVPGYSTKGALKCQSEGQAGAEKLQPTPMVEYRTMAEKHPSRAASDERFPYLDGWRGLAILLVLIAHFWDIHIPTIGRMGVDLFFVLSGLLMSQILFEKQMPIGKFYRRRISRILPVFLLFVLTVWIGWSRLGASWEELVTTLSFTRTYYTHPMILQSVLPDANLWSLNVEEQCYILLATIAAFAALRTRASLILFALAALTIPAIKLHFISRSLVPYTYTTECASAGLLLSAGYRRFATRWIAPGWAAPLALGGAFLCYCGFAPWYARFMVGPPLLALSVNHIQHSWKWIVAVFEWRPLRQLGILSYSIYLWQQLFLKYRNDFPHHTAILFALTAGAISFYLFERPTRTWINAHWQPKAGAMAPAKA
jgi:peptidoglycan/LPS O-acetylase OafA/YrhL